MSKGPKYVSEFDFGPQKTYVKAYCRGGKVEAKKAVSDHERRLHGKKGVPVASGAPLIAPKPR